MARKTIRAEWKGHGHRVNALAFSADGTRLASASSDRTAKVWEVATGALNATYDLDADWIVSLSFSPEMTPLALGGRMDVTAQMWDVAAAARVAHIQRKEGGGWGWIFSGSFSPDESLFVYGSQYWDRPTVEVWDWGAETHTATLYGHSDMVGHVRFSPDGAFFATGSRDGTILVWDLQLAIPHPQTVTKLSGDGQQMGPGLSLHDPLEVVVLDQHGRPLAGVEVTFAVTAGEGTLAETTLLTRILTEEPGEWTYETSSSSGLSELTVNAAPTGLAAVTLILGRQPGTVTVTVTVAGLDPVTFTVLAQATTDFDGDGETGFADFFLFADAFGSSDPRFDLDGSGSVDFADFFLLADHFGQARGKLMALARELIGLPDGPQLQQNFPNPFNSETVISWFQLRPGPARVEVFALTGRRVAVLYQGPQKAGVYRVHWDGRDDRGRSLASGVYLYRLITDQHVQTRRLTLLR